jgi:uncharacterized protein YqjF (DUF2071 family)
MAMTWSRLLFMHWPVPVGSLRPHVPAMLDIDTFDGHAWLGVVPFTMAGVRARFTPALPGPGAFHELNVRTYVTYRDKPGVWFFSLDAASRTAVEAARLGFRLAYFKARMSLEEHDGRIDYASERTDGRGKPASLRCTYHATGTPQRAQPGSLGSFLTDRYRLFASDLPPREPKRIWVGEIDHDPWLLAPASCEVEHNSMAAPLGIETPAGKALLHMAEPVCVRAWWPRRLL